MVLVAIALLASCSQQPVTLTLAADTYLDRKASDVNAGREPLLIGGIDKTILVKFPDLGLKVGAGKKVTSAKLVLSISRPGEPSLGSISRVLKPWYEGGNTSEQVKADQGSATWAESVSGKDGLKWERDGAAGGNDARPIGTKQTSFENDLFTIGGLENAVQEMIDNPQENYGFRLAFSNSVAFFSFDSLALGPTLVLTLEDKPDAPAPDLQVLYCEPTPSQTPGSVLWQITVRNAGDQEAPAPTVSLIQPGHDAETARSTENLAAGAITQISVDLPMKSSSQPVASQSFIVHASSNVADRNPSDNGIVFYPTGLALAVPGEDAAKVQEAVSNLNERVFPFSKFGAWPKGCVERLRLVRTEPIVTVKGGSDLTRAILKAVEGIPDSLLRPFQGEAPTVDGMKATGFVSDLGQVGLLPDTRDDVLIPKDLAIPDRTSTTNAFGDVPMNELMMLSRSEVTIINSQVGKARGLPWHMTPTTVFFRVISPDGVPPVGAKFSVYQMVGGSFGSQPVFTTQLEADGSALIPPRDGGSFGSANPFGDLQKDGSNGWLLAVVSTKDGSQSTWIPVWQLWDEYIRGHDAIALLELRVQIASGPLDTTQNLALDRLVTDAKNRFPAQLNALVDGKNETSLPLGDEQDDYWIDIDLGRDRQIGQIELVFDGAPWKQFRVLTYKTAQSPTDSLLWAEESNGPGNPLAVKTEGGVVSLGYTSRSVRSRFIRIVPLSRESVKLAEIRVVPIKT